MNNCPRIAIIAGVLLLAGCGGGDGDGGGGIGISNQAPIAGTDTVEIAAGQTATVDILQNDHDPEGHRLSASVMSAPGTTSAQINSAGRMVVTPGLEQSGVITILYELRDQYGATAVGLVVVRLPLRHPVVYLADQDTRLVLELFISDGLRRHKLNRPLAANEDVRDFQLARAAPVVAYGIDSNGLEVVALRDLARNPVALPAGMDTFSEFALSDDGSYLAFVASKDSVRHLYVLDLDSAGGAQEVPLGASTTNDWISDLRFTGRNLSFVFRRYVATSHWQSVILRVDAAAPAAFTPITRVLDQSPGSSTSAIFQHQLTADGTRVVYWGSHSGTPVVIAADTQPPHAEQRLSPDAGAAALNISRMVMNEPATHVAFTAAVGDTRYHLYLADLRLAGNAQRIDPDSVEGSDIYAVLDMALSDDAGRVAYLVHTTAGSRAVVATDVAAGNSMMATSGENHYAFDMRPDGLQFAGSRLYSVLARFDRPGSPAIISLRQPGGPSVQYEGAAYSPDSKVLVLLETTSTGRGLLFLNPDNNPSAPTWTWLPLSQVQGAGWSSMVPRFAFASPLLN